MLDAPRKNVFAFVSVFDLLTKNVPAVTDITCTEYVKALVDAGLSSTLNPNNSLSAAGPSAICPSVLDPAASPTKIAVPLRANLIPPTADPASLEALNDATTKIFDVFAVGVIDTVNPVTSVKDVDEVVKVDDKVVLKTCPTLPNAAKLKFALSDAAVKTSPAV